MLNRTHLSHTTTQPGSVGVSLPREEIHCCFFPGKVVLSSCSYMMTEVSILAHDSNGRRMDMLKDRRN